MFRRTRPEPGIESPISDRSEVSLRVSQESTAQALNVCVECVHGCAGKQSLRVCQVDETENHCLSQIAKVEMKREIGRWHTRRLIMRVMFQWKLRCGKLVVPQ
jgi:hypothetical protein